MKIYSGGNQIEEARNPCNYITHIIKLFYDVWTDEFIFFDDEPEKEILEKWFPSYDRIDEDTFRDDEQTMPVKYYIEFNKFANWYIVYGMKQFRHDVSWTSTRIRWQRNNKCI